MQLERGASPLVVLRRDQPMVELLVLGARGIERLRQRIEPFGDGNQLSIRQSFNSFDILFRDLARLTTTFCIQQPRFVNTRVCRT